MEQRVRDTPLVTFNNFLAIISNHVHNAVFSTSSQQSMFLFVGIFFNGGYFSLIIRFITSIHRYTVTLP